jgi:hypothetical protein
MTHFTILSLPNFKDSNGSLTVLEKVLPFEILRVYWIYGADGQTRGRHRHFFTRQALVALSGSVSVYMNNGIISETIVLNDPSRCLLVEPEDWHTMFFEKNAILLVLSSHLYDRSEYIDLPYDSLPHD